MPETVCKDGFKLAFVLPCSLCGRHPEVWSCYKGMTPGMGPFGIACSHGRPGIGRFCRSWDEGRVVENWNRMQQDCSVN